MTKDQSEEDAAKQCVVFGHQWVVDLVMLPWNWHAGRTCHRCGRHEPAHQWATPTPEGTD